MALSIHTINNLVKNEGDDKFISNTGLSDIDVHELSFKNKSFLYKQKKYNDNLIELSKLDDKSNHNIDRNTRSNVFHMEGPLTHFERKYILANIPMYELTANLGKKKDL